MSATAPDDSTVRAPASGSAPPIFIIGSPRSGTTLTRVILNAHWSVEDAQRAGRVLRPDERDWITQCITIAKAVQG